MQDSLSKYKNDLDALILKGNSLLMAMQYECLEDINEDDLTEDQKKLIRDFPKVKDDYQIWYSEAKVVVKQLLPDRLDDFISHYKKPKQRKAITYENYRIEDYLQHLTVRTGVGTTVVSPSAAIPHLKQRQSILSAVFSRFKSSLFDIKQLLQADLFDSELAASKELLKNGFVRASGAVAGVVLERHLSQVLLNHKLTSRKKNPSISDFNDILKKRKYY